MTHWCLAVKIQYNHEWTRINTNENRRCNDFLPTQSSSPNRDCKAGHPKSLNRRAIRVYSCPFVVSHCMDTAKSRSNSEKVVCIKNQQFLCRRFAVADTRDQAER